MSSSVKRKDDTRSKNNGVSDESAGKKRGWDEIESLFDKKKGKKMAAISRKEQTAGKCRNQKGQESQKSNTRGIEKGQWVDDGLGGKYDDEGFTGRREDGIKVFKAHVMQKPNAGRTEKCPFDCDCCFV